MKRCAKCHAEKPLDEFTKQIGGKQGRCAWCKLCNRERANLFHAEHKEERNRKSREQHAKNREHNNKLSREWYERHKDYALASRKEYRQLPEVKERKRLQSAKDYRTPERKAYLAEYRLRPGYRERRRAIVRAWDTKNRASIAEKVGKRHREDPWFRLRRNLSRAVTGYIKRHGGKKHHVTLELTGCSRTHLREHLEIQFKEGMTWDNYGKIWHVDHIVPCSLFNLQDVNQQRDCFNYRNLQPLFCAENISKGNKLI